MQLVFDYINNIYFLYFVCSVKWHNLDKYTKIISTLACEISTYCRDGTKY